MAGELEAYAKKNKIKFFLFNFTDLFGTQRAKLEADTAQPQRLLTEPGIGYRIVEPD
jgi:glutamine synthetase